MPPEFLFPWNERPPTTDILFPAVSFRFSRRSNPTNCLRTGLLLLLLPQSEQTNTGDLDDLETDTGNITLGLTLTTETSEENLVVLVDEVQATVVGDCKNSKSAYVSQLFCLYFDLPAQISNLQQTKN